MTGKVFDYPKTIRDKLIIPSEIDVILNSTSNKTYFSSTLLLFTKLLTIKVRFWQN